MSTLVTLGCVRPGQLVAIGTDDGPELPAFVYVPRQLQPDAPLLVSVHGYTRNALSHAIRFRDLADHHGAACVVPCFSRDRHRRYQQLARGRHGEAPDEALCALLDGVQGALKLRSGPALMFGFSGGGQFVHRFALRHPQRVGAAAVAAPGWYTFPDTDADWPHGIRTPAGQGQPQLDALLRTPLLVLVGDRDTQQDELLNSAARIVEQQGRHRLERAQRWVAAMHAAALARNLPPRVSLALMPGVGHSFESAMDRHNMLRLVSSHFFPVSASPSPTLHSSRVSA